MRGHCAAAALAVTGLLIADDAAGSPARKFICGTPDAQSGALTKSADLPKIVKVYSGKPPALILQAPGTASSHGSNFNGLKSFIDGALRDAGYGKDAAGDKGYSV